MIKTKITGFTVALAIAGLMMPVGIATAAVEPTEFPATSYAPVYLVDGNDNVQFAPGTTMGWDDWRMAHLSAIPVATTPTDYETVRLPYVAGSEQYINFISLPGDEFSRSTWIAWGDKWDLVNNKGPLLPFVLPTTVLYGNPGSVKAAGGTYSLGIAYIHTNGLYVVTAFFTTINVDAGTGDWKFATPVTKQATSTALSASATSVSLGTAVELTATVTPSAATGNVQFLDGGNSLGIAASAGGVATLTANSLAAGSHSITAVFAGDSTYAGSTSAPVVVEVAPIVGPDESELISTNTGGISVTVEGKNAIITMNASNNGKVVNVFGYSTPVLLGQRTVSGGEAVVSLAGLPAGEHKIAVVDATTSAIIGWAGGVMVASADMEGMRDLQAEVTRSTDGELKLIAPDNSTPALINNPVLGADGRSLSTGVLGAFSVIDERLLSKPGWDLTTAVDSFTNGTDTIDNTSLGLAPQLVSNTGPGVPTLGAEQLAGIAVYSSRFAELVAGSHDNKADFNAALSFKAPLGAVPGTYTSQLTLTLVSK